MKKALVSLRKMKKSEARKKGLEVHTNTKMVPEDEKPPISLTVR